MARKIVCKTCKSGHLHKIPHGTPSGYMYHGCDCSECLEWKRGYRRVEDADWRRAHAVRINADARERRSKDPAFRARKNRQLRDSRLRNTERFVEQSREYRARRRPTALAEMRDWRGRNASYRAIYAKKYSARHRFPVCRGRSDAWTPEEERIAATPGITATEVAYLTGRSWEASRKRISQHRKEQAA